MSKVHGTFLSRSTAPEQLLSPSCMLGADSALRARLRNELKGPRETEPDISSDAKGNPPPITQEIFTLYEGLSLRARLRPRCCNATVRIVLALRNSLSKGGGRQ